MHRQQSGAALAAPPLRHSAFADAAAFVLVALLAVLWSGGGLLVQGLALPAHGNASEVHHLDATSAPPTPVGPDAALGQAQLDAAAADAKADWQAVRPSADLSSLTFSVQDLPDLGLGSQSGSSIVVDVDAAGWGWSAMSLPTVLRHEIGHYLGLDHTDSGLMAPALAPGDSFAVPASYAETTSTGTTAAADTGTTGTGTTGTGTTGTGTTTGTTAGTTATGTTGTGTTGTGTSPTDTGTTDTGTTDTGTTGTGTSPTDTGTTDTGTTGTGTSPAKLTSTASALTTLSPDTTATPATAGVTWSGSTVTITGTDGADSITIAKTSDGYTVTLNGVDTAVTPGSNATFTIDGAGGSDTLAVPDLDGTWHITGIDAGSWKATGATVNFSNVESLVGASTAADDFTFDEKAGMTGSIDDGAGTLTVEVAGYFKVSGDFDFSQAQDSVSVVPSTGGAGASTDANVLTLTGTGGEGFFGVSGLGSAAGLSGSISNFTLAIATAGTQAWQAFDGTMTSPTFTAPEGIELDMALRDATIGINTASADGSWVDFSTGTVTGLSFAGKELQVTVPVLLDLGGFLHVDGDLTITRGGVASVDVDTGLDSSTATQAIKDITTVSDTDPGTGVARSSDYSKLWNVQVSSLEFALTNANAFVGTGFGWTDHNGDGVMDKSEISESAVGLFGGGINLAFLLLTPIGGMPITNRFIGLKGRVGTFGLLGLGDLFSLGADDLQVEANLGSPIAGAKDATVDWASSFPDGTGTGEAGYALTTGVDPLVLGLTGPVLRVSADRVLLTVANFVYISGGFSMTAGGSEDVDVDVSGISTGQWDSMVSAVAGGSGSVTTDETQQILHGVHVATTLVGISDATIFVGYAPDGFTADEVPDATNTANGFGALASGITVGMVIASPEAGQVGDYQLPTFFALQAAVDSVTFPGLPTGYFDLAFNGLTLSVNRGGAIKDGTGTSLSTVDPPGTTPTSLAVVDWASSFPAEGAGGEAGLEVPTGTTTDPVLIALTDPVIGVTADQVLLTISDFVYVSGGFSLVAGQLENVDVDLHGISASQWDDLVAAIGNPDPTDETTLGTGPDQTVLNLLVKTTLIGISDATVFVGYDPDGFTAGTPPSAANTDNAFGILATGIDVGMVFASPQPDQVTGYTFAPFFALHAAIDSLTFPGLPTDYFNLSFQGVTLSVNSGGPVKHNGTALTEGSVTKPTSLANVDWAASFPDDGGLAVPTGTTTEPVLIDLADPVVGVTADRVLLTISDFVYVSGGFSFVAGNLEKVAVDVYGISNAQWDTLKTDLATLHPSPGEGDLQTSATGHTILNLLVQTTMFGISDATVFIGYQPGGFTVEEPPTIENTADAFGVLATGINVGMVVATPVPGQLGDAATGYTFAPFFALKASIATLTFPGLPRDVFDLEFKDIVLTVNSGGVVKHAGVAVSTAGGSSPATSLAVVDWAASFPNVADPTSPGLAVPTGTTTDPVLIGFDDPVVGVSAGLVVLSISDFIYISGGFSFTVGGRESVDVEALQLGVAGAGLVTAVHNLSDTDPQDGSLATNSDGSRIWNLPVETTVLGIANANIFVGYNPDGFDPTLSHQFTEADIPSDAIGVYAGDISVGMLLAKAEQGVITGYSFSAFYAVKALIGELDFVGIPTSDFGILLRGIGLEVNGGGAVREGSAPGAPIAGSRAVIDFASSFPGDATTDPVTPVGFAVPTGTGNDPVYLDFHGPVIGVSATEVVLAISDFVYIKGGFSFEKGGTESVDLTTEGLSLAGAALAEQINSENVLACGTGSATDPGTSVACASPDGTHLWNVPVYTTMLGISDADVFVGYNPNEPGTSGTSFSLDDPLECDQLSANAIGLCATGINVGLVYASVIPDPLQTWRAELPGFWAVRATMELLTPVGFDPDVFQLAIRGAGLSINHGGQVGATVGSLAWVDWAHSFPADPNAVPATTEDGLEVPTGTGNTPITVGFSDPIIGVEAQDVLLSIGQYVFIEGGFSFVQGGRASVSIDTGLDSVTDAPTCVDLGLAATASKTSSDPVTLSSDCTTLSGVAVRTMTIGIHEASLFLGYNPMPADATFEPGTDGLPGLGEGDLSRDAIGFLVTNVNLGLVIASLAPSAFQDALSGHGATKTPTFFALNAHADFLGLVGLEDYFNLKAWGVTVQVNVGGKWTTAAEAATGPAIDWAASFPASGDDPAGYAVPTGGDNPPAYIDYDGYLIGGGVNRFVLSISNFVFLTGGFYFEFGPTRVMPLTDGIADTSILDSLGLSSILDGNLLADCPADTPDNTRCISLRFLTLGAQHVNAFVGSGPYWRTDTDGNLLYTVGGTDGGTSCDPDTYTGAGTCSREINPDAVGLVLSDVNFAMAMMTPTLRANPMRFIALQASAQQIALVGVNGLTASATDLQVKLNISTPTLEGLPVLPVVDFAQYADTNGGDPYAVKVAAPATSADDPVVVPFTFDSALIEAQGTLNLDVFGVLALRGSLALVLGPTADVTLEDGTTVVDNVTTMTLGGSHLMGFIGIDGPQWLLDAGGNVIYTTNGKPVGTDGGAACVPTQGNTNCQVAINPDAVGIGITDLNFGIFIGAKVDPTNPAAYVAANIDVTSFGFYGLSGFTALGTLALMLNLGLAIGATTKLGAINFKKSFTYDPQGDEGVDGDGDPSSTANLAACTSAGKDGQGTQTDPDCDNLPGLAVPTGDITHPIVLDYETSLLQVQLAGIINIDNVVQALGIFYLDVSPQGLDLLVDAQLLVGPDMITAADLNTGLVDGDHAQLPTAEQPLLQINAFGALIVNKDGVAADFAVQLALNIPGFSVDVAARLILNSTAKDQELRLPDRLFTFLSDNSDGNELVQDLLGRLQHCTSGSDPAGTNRCYVIAGRAPNLIASNGGADAGSVNALLGLPGGAISYEATPSAYVVVAIYGSFDLLDFATATGLAALKVSGDAFEMVVSVDFQLGPSSSTSLHVHADGALGIYSDGISLDVNVQVKANLLSVFDLDVNGSLVIDTTSHVTSTARPGDPDYFHLNLTGNVSVLHLITLNGTLDIAVADNAWSVSASLGASFGPLSVSASGWIRSSGSFDFEFTGTVDLTIAGTGIEGGIHARAAFCDFGTTNPDALTSSSACLDSPTLMPVGSAAAQAYDQNPGTLNGRLFLIELDGHVDVKVFGISLAGAGIEFLGAGSLGGEIVVKAAFHVHVLFFSATAHVTIAHFYLPVSLVNANAPPPNLAFLDSSTGVLTLNVGQLNITNRTGDVNHVRINSSQTGEDYQVHQDSCDPDPTKGCTITVTAFGAKQTFTGVKSISGDFGSGDDSFSTVGDLTLPVTLSGGSGDDALVYQGSGIATLDGGSGDDYLAGGSAADVLTGGLGNDFLQGHGGNDTITAGPESVASGVNDDDTVVGTPDELIGDSIAAGAGTDTLDIIGNPGSDTIDLGVNGTALRLGYNSQTVDMTGFEATTLFTQGSDHVTLTGDLHAAGIINVTIALGSPYDTTDSDGVLTHHAGGQATVSVNLVDSADAVNVSGGLAGGVLLPSPTAGPVSITPDDDTPHNVATTTSVWSGHYTLVISGSLLTTGDLDTYTLNTLGGDDQVNVSSLATQTTVNGGAGNDTVRVGSNAATDNAGGTLDGIDAPLTVNGGADTDTLAIDDTGAQAGQTGTLTSTKLTGLGLYTDGLTYGGFETIGLGLGHGDDSLVVTSTATGATTTIHGNAGNDSFDIQSVGGPTLVYGDAGNDTFTVGQGATSRTLDQIQAYLELQGGAGADTLTAEDNADTTGDIGYVTDQQIAGFGMGTDTGHPGPDTAWSITISGATGGNITLTFAGHTAITFPYDDDPAALQAAINAVLGANAVTVTRSPLTRGTGTTYLIRWTGAQTGAPPALTMTSNLLGAGASASLAQMSDGAIHYGSIETLTVDLGSGADLVDVDSTPLGTTTTLDTGAGDDVITLETTGGATAIRAGAGEDSITVNALPDLPTTGNGLVGRLTLAGGLGSDTYTIQTFGTGDSRIDVLDALDTSGGSSTDTNVLIIDGSSGNDTFLLRKGLVANLNTGLTTPTGQIQQSYAHAEQITYDNSINGGLVVNTLAGNDTVAFDDNSTITTVNGGAGDDTFQVGQMYGDNVHFDGSFTPDFTDTTRGMLTNGVSYSTTINGGAGNDTFSILRNKAMLQLNGEAGDDTFIIRTFAKEGSTDAGSTAPPTDDAHTDVAAGGGDDHVSYVMNAPVSINGGAGFDTIVVIGTEFDDSFVIASGGVWGGGRYVAFVGIEKLDVDGAEGDDTFTVVSTRAGMQTRIYGGLGSDTINVGTSAPIVVADDLQGHSGIIENSVESTVGSWQGIPVDGVATGVTDNDAPAADVIQTAGTTVVYEHGATSDTFTIKLSKTPTSPVSVTVAAPYPSPDDLAAHAQTVLVSLDGINWSTSVTVVLSGSKMSQRIYVKAIDDAAAEGVQLVPLQLLVVQPGGEYDGLVLPNVYVRVVDDDQAGVTVVAANPIHVTEGGSGSSYTVGIAKQPSGTVTVAVDPGPGMQVSTDGITWAATLTLTFTHSDWAAQRVYVRATDDHVVEGTQYATVTAKVTASADPTYTGLAGDDVSVLVYDADSPGVEILESDGGTHVTEGGDTDSYQVRLNSNPCPGGSCTVTITSTAVATKTLNGDVEHNDVQVQVSTDGIHWGDSVELTFTGDNWDTYQTVDVRAVDDGYVDGSDYQAFAATDTHRVFQIQGPLYVFGGENPDASYTIPDPVMLPGESSDELHTTPNPNFDMDEAKQVDTLVVDNAGSVAADTGTLTSGRITGLGMGGDQTVDGKALQGGITYQDLEDLQIQLGSGNDTFTVASTHHGRTEITGGAGNDAFTVDTVSGHTHIDAGAGDDSFTIGSGGLVSGLTGLLVIDGGAGSDTATIDDSHATADELATITQHTVSGMEMVARTGIDRTYLLTVHADSGTFTISLAGYGTATFDVGSSAAEIQASLQALMFANPKSCGLPAGTGSTPGQDSRCAASVFVWQQGSSYVIGLTGEVGGLDAPALTSSQTDLQLLDGIAYWGLEDLHLTTGSGNDGINIRGTTAHTTVATGAGDDLVLVSDAADLGNLPDRLDAVDLSHLAAALRASGGDVAALLAAILNGTLTIDDQTFSGSLDLVTGALDIDGGAGSNTVAVSDRGDTGPDTHVVVTDHGVTGLAPAAITWTATGGDLAGQGYWTRQADSGLFGHGVMIMMGSGGNTGTISSVRGGATAGDPFGATVTTIWTGEGDDAFTVTANAPAGSARLVVLGQGGDDSITAAPTANQPLVLFGGPGADTLTGGAGNDTIFGDDGRVYYLAPTGGAGYDIVFGGAPVSGHLVDPRTGSRVAADSVFLTPDLVRTADTSIGTGDTLSGAGGNDILLGGKDSDTISGGIGNDLAFGDFAWIGANAGGFVDQTKLPMSMSLATHPFGFVSIDTTDGNGAADTINGDDGNDILLGQQGGDTINGGNGDDDIIGGHNVAGGNDGADIITGGAGNDVVLGDNGTVLRTGSPISPLVRVLVGTRLYLLDPATGTFYGGNTITGTAQSNPTSVETRAITILDHSTSTLRSSYGADTIKAGDGNDLVFGELGNDVIDAGLGDDYVEGNGGNDTIYGGLGQDDLIGGSSDLFGLDTRAKRPDGSDLIYGGDGTEAGRNDAGDTSSSGHANDADVLVGDNGDVFRIVGTGGKVAKGGGFLTFTYDNYGGLRLIPRVVELLDYSPTGGAGYWDASADPAHPVWMKGTGTNIGAGDFLHGEGGDDTIHGMTGDDAIFGDGQDDDLYGEAGQDWISGGAGTDGILGDDGLLITSRNGQTEPLEGVTTANKQTTIRGSGPQFSATTYPKGLLNKAADLEPFATGYDDVIYGGLGDDFIHGGLGDDAISGGEALPVYYTDDPLATLAQYYVDNDPLQWGVGDSAEKFLYYNPNNPRQLITVCPVGSDGTSGCIPFLVTNDPREDDGNDAIFGDGGNDWLSGGTGADHMYGGWGFDVLNADDDMTTDPTNANPDSPPAGQTNADFAFGGAGYDVLIGNSQDDRLIDWLGEYNSYIVPFNPFGSGAVWRAADPATVAFLYRLSAADGTDLTRGGDSTRNSEPNGELGLVLSSDPAWGDQSAQPQDPQPGNGGSVNTSMSTTYTLASAPALTGDATATDPTDVGGTVAASWVGGSHLAVAISPTDTSGSTPIVVTVVVVDASGATLATSQLCLAPGSATGSVMLSAADLGLSGGGLFSATWVPADDPAGSTYELVLRQLA